MLHSIAMGPARRRRLTSRPREGVGACTARRAETEGPALGQNPRGTIVYTPERVVFLIVKNSRARPEQLPPSDEEKIALFDTMFAYSGSYTVESDQDRVVHHVDLSWNEAWSGMDQVRFCKVDKQTLTYSSTPAKNPFDGREVVHEVTYEREVGAPIKERAELSN
jgi:hypothetical protein